ncbi:hypothetical protein ACFYZ8_33620 [Streptomyces sp. NPDC001668]|uniref:hypothetical protein n=1 Tax=Streptomyces sp. NPDC001668 TaxID=3364598 RepID=UPI003675DA2F
MRPVLRRTAMAAATTAVLVGGIAATATPASAVGSSACTRNDRNHSVWGPNLEWPNIRTGPGVAYKSKGHLDSAGEFWVECSAVNKYGNRWYYGESLSSSSYGVKGWVAASWF